MPSYLTGTRSVPAWVQDRISSSDSPTTRDILIVRLPDWWVNLRSTINNDSNSNQTHLNI